MSHLLFVCTANLQRSPTAASLFSECPDIETRSAGTNASVRGRQLSQEFIDWADIIFVMSEEREGHASYVRKKFTLKGKLVHDLEITDIYTVNSLELKEVLIERVSNYIDLKPCLEKLSEDIRE